MPWLTRAVLAVAVAQQRAASQDSATVLTQQQLVGLHRAADSNGDGKLSLAELVDHLLHHQRKLAIAELPDFKQVMDTNRDGLVSVAEHLQQFASVDGDDMDADPVAATRKIQETEVRRFNAADANRDGQLDDSELPQFLYMELEPGTVAAVSAKITIEEMDTNGDGFLSESEVEDDGDADKTMFVDFKGLDMDSDGKLNFDEVKRFQTMLHYTELELNTLIDVADADSDRHVSVTELTSAREKLPNSSAYYHVLQWAETMGRDEL